MINARLRFSAAGVRKGMISAVPLKLEAERLTARRADDGLAHGQVGDVLVLHHKALPDLFRHAPILDGGQVGLELDVPAEQAFDVLPGTGVVDPERQSGAKAGEDAVCQILAVGGGNLVNVLEANKELSP